MRGAAMAAVDAGRTDCAQRSSDIDVHGCSDYTESASLQET